MSRVYFCVAVGIEAETSISLKNYAFSGIESGNVILYLLTVMYILPVRTKCGKDGKFGVLIRCFWAIHVAADGRATLSDHGDILFKNVRIRCGVYRTDISQERWHFENGF